MYWTHLLPLQVAEFSLAKLFSLMVPADVINSTKYSYCE